MNRWIILAAAFVWATGPGAASARSACAGAQHACKGQHRAHRPRRAFYGEGSLGNQTLTPSTPPPSQRELPVPTQPERLYPPGVAAPSPFLPNNLPSTFLPQKF